MRNPSKYVRKAYLSLLGDMSIPIFDRRIPVGKNIPGLYILITSQTNNISRENKCGHSWEVSIVLDVVNRTERSFVDSAVVDDIEEQISDRLDFWTASKTDIPIPPFVVYHTTMQNSTDFELETPTETIIRRVIRYVHVLSGELS